MRNCSSNFEIETGRRRTGTREVLLIFVGVILLLQGCSDSPPPPAPSPGDRLEAGIVYVFEPDSQDYLAAPKPFSLADGVSPGEALAALGDHLSRTYFGRDGGKGDRGIRFQVMGIHRFPVAQRAYRLAVIDMIDPQRKALQGFFQGSAGGLTTYYLMAATFLQPQLDPPLVDGLVLLYNGEEFPAMDHVNLRGIVTPAAVRPVVTKILYRYRPGETAAAG